jgi:hypothetical protein
MHVAILGAGALGRVYGVRLATAQAGHPDISFVVRPARVSERGAFPIVRIDGDRAEHTLPEPVRTLAVPAHADVVLVCVRAEQMVEVLPLLSQRPAASVVLLTPMMPHEYERIAQRLGPRVRAAMPGVVAYVNPEGVTRYWLPRVAPTLIDEPRPPIATVTELVAALQASGVPTCLELGVHEMNPATTVAFIPLVMGLDAAGSIDALLADRALLGLSIRATKEGLQLSKRLGRAAGWVGMLTRFVGPRMLKIGVAIGRSRSPEAVRYVEEHFGRKLRAQNVEMATAMIELAREKGTSHAALESLHARLVQR